MRRDLIHWDLDTIGTVYCIEMDDTRASSKFVMLKIMALRSWQGHNFKFIKGEYIWSVDETRLSYERWKNPFRKNYIHG
jgi:hypothetical protein